MVKAFSAFCCNWKRGVVQNFRIRKENPDSFRRILFLKIVYWFLSIYFMLFQYKDKHAGHECCGSSHQTGDSFQIYLKTDTESICIADLEASRIDKSVWYKWSWMIFSNSPTYLRWTEEEQRNERDLKGILARDFSAWFALSIACAC